MTIKEDDDKDDNDVHQINNKTKKKNVKLVRVQKQLLLGVEEQF